MRADQRTTQSREIPAVDDRATATERGVAAAMQPVLEAFFPQGPPVQVRFWDGSTVGPADGPGVAVVRDPHALRQMLWAPGELGLGRAFVAGDLDIEGDIVEVLQLLQHGSVRSGRERHGPGPSAVRAVLSAARRSGALGPPLAAPPEEAHQRGRVHSRRRDADAISHHYDVGNEFYRLVLGPSMTYSCARFVDPMSTLEQAQDAKFDLVCRKLGLHERPGMRLLDVGCGWGSLALYAARTYGAQVVGVSISREQVDLASSRIARSGFDGQVEVRLQDYRDLGGETFDAISSIGMFEHVGSRRLAEYFETLHGLLAPRGRLLNHAISSVGGSKLGTRSFIGRYVFPDGELIDVGQVLLGMEAAGFEVRDVESLREHYETTLRAWVSNLEASWEDAVDLVGEGRARVWRLYMAASAVGFHDGGISIHQVLGVLPGPDGDSAMPRTRVDMV